MTARRAKRTIGLSAFSLALLSVTGPVSGTPPGASSNVPSGPAPCRAAAGHAGSGVASAGHSTAYWRALKQADFKLSAGDSAGALALEAAALFGSPDPELRDEIAYEAIAAWVYRDRALSATELEALRATLAGNALVKLGSGGDDSLFLRSFSLLGLSVLAAADLEQHFLSPEHFEGLLQLVTRCLTEERDLRGYIPVQGWGHATAHAADLLKFLARSPHLRQEQQRQIVGAVRRRLQSAGSVFVWGEDQRLAAALAGLVSRPDFDLEPFARWFAALRDRHKALWSGVFDPGGYVQERAQLNTLAHLSLALDGELDSAKTQALRTLLRALYRDVR